MPIGARMSSSRCSRTSSAIPSPIGQAEDLQRSRGAGFDAHLVKPVDLAKLERALAGITAAGPTGSGLDRSNEEWV